MEVTLFEVTLRSIETHNLFNSFWRKSIDSNKV
jgi:hypothetical protein